MILSKTELNQLKTEITVETNDILKNIVSVQPIKSSIENVFRFQYNKTDSDRISLNIVSYPMQASPLIIKTKSCSPYEFKQTIVNESIKDVITNLIENDDDILNMTDFYPLNIAINDIARSTRRSAGNFILVNPKSLTSFWVDVLDMTNLQMYADVVFMTTNNTPFQYVGLYNNFVKVFVSAYVPEGKILVGYNGSSGIDSGFIYAPHEIAINNRVLNGLRLNKVEISRGAQMFNKNYYRTLSFK